MAVFTISIQLEDLSEAAPKGVIHEGQEHTSHDVFLARFLNLTRGSPPFGIAPARDQAPGFGQRRINQVGRATDPVREAFARLTVGQVQGLCPQRR